MNVASAQIDHLKLKAGLNLQEERIIGNVKVFFYDLRFKQPLKVNCEDNEWLRPRTVHTIEHLLAVKLREVSEELGSSSERIISVFPYGCMTGFGVISILQPDDFSEILKETLEIVVKATEVPFAKKELCGNAIFHDLEDACFEIREFIKVMVENKFKCNESPRIK